MTVDQIDGEASVNKVQQLLAEEAHLSSTLRAALEVLIMLVQLLANRLSLNSRNCSKPPSTNRFKKNDKADKDDGNPKSGKNNKPGGQPGRIGTTLQKADDPDELKILELDWTTLLPGEYKEAGFESRQVFDIDIRRVVTEYRAEVLVGLGASWCLPDPAIRYTEQYRALLQQAELECPPPDPQRKLGQRGRGVKPRKARNLLEQLLNYEQETLRFMTDARVPFTNNQCENDISTHPPCSRKIGESS